MAGTNSNSTEDPTSQPQHPRQPAEPPHPEKRSSCQRWCQGRLCLPAILLAVAVGLAITVPIVLLVDSVRERYAPEQDWWRKGIVYQVYPLSFQDSNDDGVGDLKGITSRLQYFSDLNVKAIWLNPFYPSPMQDLGYDVSNFTGVGSLFGTLNDFDELIKEAHDKDLKVIIDFVAGHTSSEHDWFQKSSSRTPPYEDYYIWSNGTTNPDGTHEPPSNWVSAYGQSAWNWSDARQQYYYHAFLAEQPTLNYRNPLVVEEMKNVLIFWLEREVDGIRVDAVSKIMVYHNYSQDQERSYIPGVESWDPRYYINNLTTDIPEIGDIVRGWRAVLDDYDDSDHKNDNYKLMMVEQYDSAEERSKYYDYGADLPFNFDLVFGLDNQGRDLNDSKYCDALCVRDLIQKEYDSLPENEWPNFVLSNHDNPRVASRMGQGYVDALNLMLLTLRGTPTTYYGDEIGMEDLPTSPAVHLPGVVYKENRTRERSLMQWNSENKAGFSNASQTWMPVHPDYTTRNVEDQKADPKVTNLQVYRDLATLRDEPAFRYGLFHFGDVTPDILSYLRSATDYSQYFVAINFGRTSVEHDFSGPPANVTSAMVKVATSAAANEGRFVKGNAVPLNPVTLKPGDGVVFELPVAKG